MNKVIAKSRIEQAFVGCETISHFKKLVLEIIDDMYASQSNSHKHSVMQGLPTEEEIRAQALLMENPNDGYAVKIIARAAYESGARWAITKMSSSPSVASEGQGEANMCADEMCGSDCCPDDGMCEHCRNPIRKSG